MIGGITARTARTIVAAVIGLDLLAMAVLSVHKSTATRTTTIPLAAPAPPAATTPAPVAATPSAPIAAPVIAAPPPPVPAVPIAAHSSEPAPGPVRHVRTPSPPPSSSPPPSPPPSGPPVKPAAACPLPLQPPAETGGLQSLIGMVPAFGPFSAEAFAMAPAYAPLLDLMGPILAKYPDLQAQAQPLLGPLFNAMGMFANAGFDILKPLYEPYRQKMLAAEAKFAAAIAPFAEKAAGSPMGTCLIDLEGALIAASVPKTAG
jgi:hypothetical protein